MNRRTVSAPTSPAASQIFSHVSVGWPVALTREPRFHLERFLIRSVLIAFSFDVGFFF